MNKSPVSNLVLPAMRWCRHGLTLCCLSLALNALAATPPAVHRFPGSMAGRIQALAQTVSMEYADDAAAIWRGVPTGSALFERLVALPGFGEQKSRIFVALLGKQCAVRPRGWREAAGAYGDARSHRSVADVRDAASLAAVRSFKQEAKAAARAR